MLQCCDGLLRHCHGTVKALSWDCQIVVMVLSKHCHGTTKVLLRGLSKHCHGTVKSLSWYCQSIVMGLSNSCHNTVMILSRVRFWAVQNLFWAGRCPKLDLNPPFTAQNCPKLPKSAQNCLKLPTDYKSAKLILGYTSNLLSLNFLLLKKIN